MDKKKWGYHAGICVAVCLLIFCGMTTKEAEKATVVQEEELHRAGSEKVRAEVVAEQGEVVETPAERDALPAEPIETSAEKSKLPTQERAETADIVCLPTGKIVHRFGWQEEDGVWRYHSGIDIAYTQNEDVRAVMGGTVQQVTQVAGGYAAEVVGKDLWRYEPLTDVNVTVGMEIEAGTVLGTICGDGTLHIGRQRGGEWIKPISMQNQIWE